MKEKFQKPLLKIGDKLVIEDKEYLVRGISREGVGLTPKRRLTLNEAECIILQSEVA